MLKVILADDIMVVVKLLTKLICRILVASMVLLPFTTHAGMIGTDQVVASAAAQANRDKVRDFVARLRDDHQMLAQGAGENVLRLLPPLIITEADIEEAVAKIAATLDDIAADSNKEHVTA